MNSYHFHGAEVQVEEGGEAYVVTSREGDCVSVFRDTQKFKAQLDRGVWEYATVYRIHKDSRVEVVQE